METLSLGLIWIFLQDWTKNFVGIHRGPSSTYLLNYVRRLCLVLYNVRLGPDHVNWTSSSPFLYDRKKKRYGEGQFYPVYEIWASPL